MSKDELIEQLAAILRPGECQRCGQLGDVPNETCDRHATYQPGTDSSTARQLSRVFDSYVARARQILGKPNAEFVL